MDPKIVDLPEIPVIGMAIDTVPVSPDIPAMWPRFVARMDEIGPVAEPGVSYGVMEGCGPGAGSDARLRYMAAVPVTPESALPEGLSRWAIPAGTYAVLRWPFGEIAQGFDFLYRQWLPASSWTLRAGPHFERYGDDFDPRDPNAILEIGLPVNAKAPGT